MPSHKTASKDKVNCEVLRAIGVEATEEEIAKWRARADIKGLSFRSDGLTTMVYPNKQVYDEKSKDFVPGEKVFVELDREVARKLQEAGAVRVVI